VLTARDWRTGLSEDWAVFEVRPTFVRTFQDVARLGRPIANWVWLLAALSLAVLLMDAVGMWMSIRLGRAISLAIDDLSTSARQIAAGNFAWRTPVRSNDQLGTLTSNFNDMATSLERLQREEAAKLQLDDDIRAAHRVQQYLFPRVAPSMRGATVSGRTLAARSIGGDLYDFYNLSTERIGVLCADVSGKGMAAALMMANLQAMARAYTARRPDGGTVRPAEFVETLNDQLAGRFGDSRYATLFWAEYNSETQLLTYVNAGHCLPILIHPGGNFERLNSGGFPIGMFRNSRYSVSEVRMDPGNRLIIFTDGVTDALNSAGEQFGEERLISCCRDVPARADATATVDTVMQATAEWGAESEPFDDTTVVVIAINSGVAEDGRRSGNTVPPEHV
jgi:serine phosphatase RsbU (regulator of sigma subunit)